jgi:hypothetical protein
VAKERPPLPFAQSLCHRCRHLRIVRGKNSAFLMCEALPQKYPPQPVRTCPAFEEKPAGR